MVWLGPSATPLFLGSSIPQTVTRIWEGLFIFARMHLLGWVWLDILHIYIYIYIYMSLPLLLLLLLLLLTLRALFYIDGLLAAWHMLWPRVRLRLAGKPRFRWKSFQFSCIFQGKRHFDIYLTFLLSLPLATFLLSFCVWFLQLPTLRISPFVFSVSS